MLVAEVAVWKFHENLISILTLTITLTASHPPLRIVMEAANSISNKTSPSVFSRPFKLLKSRNQFALPLILTFPSRPSLLWNLFSIGWVGNPHPDFILLLIWVDRLILLSRRMVRRCYLGSWLLDTSFIHDLSSTHPLKKCWEWRHSLKVWLIQNWIQKWSM